VIKNVKDRVWAFDAEWIPDPLAGRLLFGLSDSDAIPEEIMRVMWNEGGATEDDPTPFLKTVLCRIVSVSAVERRVFPDGAVAINLMNVPRDPDNPDEIRESHVIGTFLDALGRYRPQLVGFNSIDSDLKILVQRGVVLGLRAEGFCARPDKPWEGIDYFARGSDWNIDLKAVLGGWGKAVPTLHEMAVQCGIPGKLDVDGNQVAQLWLAGELRRIVQYNQFDALTTYLLWLRLAHFAGHFTGSQYAEEEQRLRGLLEKESEDPENAHLAIYLTEWERLRAATTSGRD
jgi:predicted PolB exonuclease-like 3'-5' exonuclease